jgi:hypothetical protein
MPRYYLHCTDGVDFVLDRVGHEIDAESELMWFAYRAAGRLMGELPEYDEWSNWLVAIHNENGCLVETVSFPGAADTTLAETQGASIMQPCPSNPPSYSLLPRSTLLH